MSDIFISYASENRDVAVQVAEALAAEGLSVWWDRDLKPGETYDDKIEEALGNSRAVVVLWSAESVESSWVRTESTDGNDRGCLIPARIEDVDLPLEFRRIQAADLIGWSGETDHRGYQNLLHSIEVALEREEEPDASAEGPREKTSPKTNAGATRSSAPATTKARVGGRPLLIVAVLVIAGIVAAFVLLRDSDGDPIATNPGEEVVDADPGEGAEEDDGTVAEESSVPQDLDELVDAIAPEVDLETIGSLLNPPISIGETLPPIDEKYEAVVTVPSTTDDVVVEIFSSTEKAGEGADGWLAEVARAFNEADMSTREGQTARVTIRSIPSGVGYEYIKFGRDVPDAFTPSNVLWVEMVEERVPVTEVTDQLIRNVAGVVIRSETAEGLRTTFGSDDVSAFIQGVRSGAVEMVYPNPYASSTALNFLVTVLQEAAGGDLGLPLDTGAFEEFQGHVRYTALTTLHSRRALCEGDDVDAVVMEWQTFVSTECLENMDVQFLPFGIPHDNPLYAIGDPGDAKMEVLDLFAEFARSGDFDAKAAEYGWNYPEEYVAPFDPPSGATLIGAQELWKEEKPGGRPITAVFVADVSGSMGENGNARIDALEAALVSGMDFISPETRVGLVLFSTNVQIVLEPALFDADHRGLFLHAVRNLSTRGRTAMYDGVAVGLDLALNDVVEGDRKPVVIVLTDGDTDTGWEFGDVDDIFRDLDVPIHTIGFEVPAAVEEALKDLPALVEAAYIDAAAVDLEFIISSLFRSEL